MKNHLSFLSAAIILVFAGLFFAGPGASAQKAAKENKGIHIPADVNMIIIKSCQPCHSDGGGKMAKALLNFSKWDNYSHRAQVQKSRAMCKMISKGEMPPAQFIESSPERALTKEQKDLICRWVNTTVAKK